MKNTLSDLNNYLFESLERLIDYEQAKRATYEEIFWSESEQAVVRHFLAKLPKVDAVEVVRCAYCDPGSQDYNPCWLCKKGGTAHDVEHCHVTNYGDYEPMQPHCHLCGRKL